MNLEDSLNCEFSNGYAVCNEGYQAVRDICVDERAFNISIDQAKFSQTPEIEEVDVSEIEVPVAVKRIIAKPEFHHFVSSDLNHEGKRSSGEDELQPKSFQSLADLLSMPLDKEDDISNHPDEIMEPLIGEEKIVYSGGATNGGSQSLRSESSATSARSFAFPM